MDMLFKWSYDMIVEDFAEESPGEWYRKPHEYKNVSSSQREDLITRDEHNIITQWLALESTVG